MKIDLTSFIVWFLIGLAFNYLIIAIVYFILGWTVADVPMTFTIAIVSSFIFAILVSLFDDDTSD